MPHAAVFIVAATGIAALFMLALGLGGAMKKADCMAEELRSGRSDSDS